SMYGKQGNACAHIEWGGSTHLGGEGGGGVAHAGRGPRGGGERRVVFRLVRSVVSGGLLLLLAFARCTWPPTPPPSAAHTRSAERGGGGSYGEGGRSRWRLSSSSVATGHVGRVLLDDVLQIGLHVEVGAPQIFL